MVAKAISDKANELRARIAAKDAEIQTLSKDVEAIQAEKTRYESELTELENQIPAVKVAVGIEPL